VSETESLINSHLYTPRCVSVQSSLPSVCQCGDDNVPACVNENTVFDPSTPTITFLINSTGACSHTAAKRYVNQRDSKYDVAGSLAELDAVQISLEAVRRYLAMFYR